MLDTRTFMTRLRNALIVLIATLPGLLAPDPARAFGKGPIGLWPLSERHVLIADSSLPGVVLVDLESGTAVERLVMEAANPTCISTCPGCDFALMTGTGGEIWRIHFTAPASRLLERTGVLGLERARVELLDLGEGASAIR